MFENWTVAQWVLLGMGIFELLILVLGPIITSKLGRLYAGVS